MKKEWFKSRKTFVAKAGIVSSLALLSGSLLIPSLAANAAASAEPTVVIGYENNGPDMP